MESFCALAVVRVGPWHLTNVNQRCYKSIATVRLIIETTLCLYTDLNNHSCRAVVPPPYVRGHNMTMYET